MRWSPGRPGRQGWKFIPGAGSVSSARFGSGFILLQRIHNFIFVAIKRKRANCQRSRGGNSKDS